MTHEKTYGCFDKRGKGVSRNRVSLRDACDGFRKYCRRFFGTTARHVVPPDRVLEIDDPVDFRVAQVLLEDRQLALKTDAIPNPIDVVVFDFDGVHTDDYVCITEKGGAKPFDVIELAEWQSSVPKKRG